MTSLREFLDAKLFTIGESPVTTTTLLTGLAVVLVTYLLSKMLQLGIRRTLQARGLRAEGSVGVATRLLHYLLLVTGVAVALQTAGIKLTALFAAGAVFAVGIGFAMQNIAQNFVSGVILLVEQSIKPGDVIALDGEVAKVDSMGIRATRVRTRDGERLIVPNASLVQSTVKNFTLVDALFRVRVVVGVTYSSDLRLVRETLEQVATAADFRDQAHAPQVLLVEFGSSSVDYEVAVFTHDPWFARVNMSKLREAIWWAFQKRGIVIAFPQVDVHFDPPIHEALDRLPRVA
jgi:potassium efflux system protein